MAFLRARDGWPLREVAGNREVHCEQSFAPFAQPLQQAAGWTVSGQLDDVAGKGRYPLVLVLPPRQREEARALFARALALVADGGRIVACQSNNEGARSGEGDLKQLTGLGGSLTKNHCRVYWTAPMQGQHDADLAKRWSALDAVRPIVGGRFLSRPGVFAWDRIDPASALLAEHLPADLAGRAADLGAGYGYLSRELLERCPKITALDLYEAEQRALALAELNLAPPPRRCRCASCGRTSPRVSNRATTSSSATRRSTRRRAPIARTSASASSPWPRRRCARVDACTWWPTATCRTSTRSTRALARCA